MGKTDFTRFVACALAALPLAACGGGETATVGGTVSGLATAQSVSLQNNYADTLVVTANGAFTFEADLPSSGIYGVTVSTQPIGQTCVVTDGSGAINSNDDPVTNVAVTCTTTSSLGGTVSGLAAGTSVTLADGGDQLAIAANGNFSFPGTLAAGSTYDVVVVTQPVGQTCTVANPTGTISATTVASVTVTCR